VSLFSKYWFCSSICIRTYLFYSSNTLKLRNVRRTSWNKLFWNSVICSNFNPETSAASEVAAFFVYRYLLELQKKSKNFYVNIFKMMNTAISHSLKESFVLISNANICSLLGYIRKSKSDENVTLIYIKREIQKSTHKGIGVVIKRSGYYRSDYFDVKIQFLFEVGSSF